MMGCPRAGLAHGLIMGRDDAVHMEDACLWICTFCFRRCSSSSFCTSPLQPFFIHVLHHPASHYKRFLARPRLRMDR